MNKNRRTYAGMVSALDDAVARVEAAYVRAGIWNNTLLVFTTDNGGPSGSANNFPLRGHKATAWEGGVHGVAFVRGYGIPAGTTTKELMHSTDWLPTLAGLAGALLASRLDSGLPGAGNSYELQSIAAAVIGGVLLTGAMLTSCDDCYRRAHNQGCAPSVTKTRR
jgi:arylsulfatase A-like enzyme